jgi:hypothetical protein
MFEFETFLDPLEVERIKSVFSPDRVKVRQLTLSFFHTRIPLTPTSYGRSYKALEVTPIAFNAEKILVGLLWHAMFGKKFKIVHWNILFNVFTKTINDNNQSRAILAILMIITARAGKSWNTTLVPVMTIVRRKSSEDYDKIIQELLNMLPFRLPKKAPKIESLIKFEEVEVYLRRPKDPNRIGVGYKDKGSLGSESTIEALPPDLFLEREDVFDLLLRQVKQRYQIYLE